MRRVRAQQDIKPVSEFRSNAASLIQQVQDEKRPLILTQRGHSAAVLMAASEYDKLLDELELLREVALAEQQLDAGQGVSHEDALKQVLAGLGQ
jgi:prevent-host-death family protein